jgi:hypothetical protein
LLSSAGRLKSRGDSFNVLAYLDPATVFRRGVRSFVPVVS